MTDACATILGVLSDGDEVLIEGPFSDTGITWISRLNNLTTGAEVRASNHRWKLPRQRIAQHSSETPAMSSVRGEVAGLDKRIEIQLRNIIKDSQLAQPTPFRFAVWCLKVYVRASAAGQVVAVPVEVRDYNVINGTLHDGDEIEIKHAWRQGETLHPVTIRNVSTGETITTQAYPYFGLDLRRNFLKVLAALSFLLFTVLFLAGERFKGGYLLLPIPLALVYGIISRRLARHIGDLPDWGWR